ncbi:MAG: DNA repair exonuclease [Lachnospiraceae bacterium]|nr:DNA repair exonuclease [Lachnospiraceae bacterium]
MKFIHAADIHLGAEPEKGKPWSNTRKKEIRTSFQRLIEVVNEENADFLFISGDLFHRQPLIQDLRELDYMLGKLNRAKTVVIAGNHDYIGEDSPYLTYSFHSNTYVLTGKQIEYIFFEKEKTYVYGFSYWDQEITESCYQYAKPNGQEGIHILLAHGGDAKHVPMDFEQLKWSGFDYIALGHIHKPQVIYEDLMAYPGSLEPLDATETGMHGYLLGEITEEKQIITFVPFSARCYQKTEIVLYDTMSAEEIYDTIETELVRMGPENLFHIILTGSIDPKIMLDFTDLTEDYMIVSIEDQWMAFGNFDEMLEANRDNLIGAVMLKLKDRPKALSYAMKALLSTAQ